MQAVIQTLEPLVGSVGLRSWEQLDAAPRSRLSRSMVSPPMYWVMPGTHEELAAVVRCAAQNRWRIVPCGHASKLDWGGIVKDVTLVVSTERLNRLIDHAVGDLTVTTEAGISFAQLQETLGQAGQFLAIDPRERDRATIGGIVATADTGSLRYRYNSVRDMLLGISFVRHDGEVVKAGGRVVKNVAGYDLMKLLTGSYGTLGIITQVTFRVYPVPQSSQTVVLSGDLAAIAQATQILLGSALTPSAIDVLSTQASQRLELKATSLMVRFQSIPESVQQQTERLIEVGAALGLSASVYRETDDRDLWHRAALLMSPTVQDATIVCKIGVKTSQINAVLAQLENLLPSAQVLIHAGSGLGQLIVGNVRTPQIQQARSICQSAGGFLSILQAPISFKQQIEVWGYPGNALTLMKRIKHQFDPETLFSPNRFF